jgi:glutathione synthase/RimK-type ligase-like ATP-grasp enzyme
LDGLQDKRKDFYNIQYPEMKRLATDSVRATYGKIDPLRKETGFEIYGLDFMIDDTGRVYLIEINVNPCLELCSHLLGRIIPHMLENAFRYSFFLPFVF